MVTLAKWSNTDLTNSPEVLAQLLAPLEEQQLAPARFNPRCRLETRVHWQTYAALLTCSRP
jgi:hypothetical protein